MASVLRSAAAVMACTLLLPAQDRFYPFAFNQDELQGAVDFGSLNQPLTPADRLFARDGHFFRVGADLQPGTEDDQRVRLFGVNLAFGGNFPEESDAVRIARRLRRLGVNLVRLHHMDSQPDSNPNNAGSILTNGPYPTLNPVAVKRLRTFLDALKAEGIYINLNLKVGYVFRPSVDGVPPLPDGMAMPSQSKPLHMIDRRMIELQGQFARSLIEALALPDDPILGMVEINNETALVDAWQRNQIDRYVLGDYYDQLKRGWNQYLNSKYGSTDAVAQAWQPDVAEGPELLGPLPSWRLEVHSPAQATLDVSGPDAVRVRVSRGGAPVIVKQAGFSVNTERAYLAQFEIRANLPDGVSRSVLWDVKQDVNPWRTVTSRTFNVTNQWQTVAVAFTPGFAMDGIGRFGLSVENTVAEVEVRNWTLSQPSPRGLLPGQSLEDANIDVPPQSELSSQAKLDDYLVYLASLDRDYLNAIQLAVREVSNPLIPVTGTQMEFGGVMNLDSHQDMTYLDRHYYVDHYGFPGVAWDGRDWYLTDSSNIGSGLAPFQNAASTREAGRPYTVSEYNQPWPNRQAAETDVTLAAFAAFQDWDAIMHFAYAHNREWDAGKPRAFDLTGDFTKLAAFGQAAWLFRSGAIQAGHDPVTVPLPLSYRLRATRERVNGSLAPFLATHFGLDPNVSFTRPVRVARGEEASEFRDIQVQDPYLANTGQWSYRKSDRLFLVHSPLAAGVFGFVKEQEEAGPLVVKNYGAHFVGILLTPVDRLPLAESKQMLLTIPGYALRSRAGSDPATVQGLANYPGSTTRWTLEPEPGSPKPSGDLNTGGSRPVWLSRVPVTLLLKSTGQSLTVYPLNGSGQRMEPVPVEKHEEGFLIRLHQDDVGLAPWYELVRE